jgi:hypothetical protein
MYSFIFLYFIIKNNAKQYYESVTGSRDEKRATLLPLLPTQQDPVGNLSMPESFLLVVCFNTLHVLFHVGGLEMHQWHH